MEISLSHRTGFDWSLSLNTKGMLGVHTVKLIHTESNAICQSRMVEAARESDSTATNSLYKQAGKVIDIHTSLTKEAVGSCAKKLEKQKPQRQPKVSKGSEVIKVGDLRVGVGSSGNQRLTSHGRPFMTQTTKPVSASRLAKQLEEQASIAKGNGPLEFVCCHSACGGKIASQAQTLANILGRPVVGFYGRVTDLAENGRRTFNPQTGLVAKRTKLLNSIMFYPSRAYLGMQRVFTPTWKASAP